MDIDNIVKRGSINVKESLTWTLEHHQKLLPRIEKDEISRHFISNYTNYTYLMPSQDIFDFVLLWYAFHKKNHPEESIGTKVCRDCLEFAVLLQEDTYIHEWLDYYKAHKTEDYISKKKREALISYVESYLDGSLKKEADLIIEACQNTIAKKKVYTFKVKDVTRLLLVYAKARYNRTLLSDKKKRGKYGSRTTNIAFIISTAVIS